MIWCFLFASYSFLITIFFFSLKWKMYIVSKSEFFPNNFIFSCDILFGENLFLMFHLRTPSLLHCVSYMIFKKYSRPQEFRNFLVPNIPEALIPHPLCKHHDWALIGHVSPFHCIQRSQLTVVETQFSICKKMNVV